MQAALEMVSNMKKSILEFWVGLFVLLGFVAVAILAFRVAGGQTAFGGQSNTYTVYAQFEDIGGLKPQAYWLDVYTALNWTRKVSKPKCVWIWINNTNTA